MPDTGRRVFVTGAQGQVARAVARQYAARRDTVRVAGRASVDIGDRAAVAAAIAEFAPDIVINAAGYTMVDRAEDDASETFRVNRDGAAYVAEAAATANAALIHLSTDYVYNGQKTAPYIESDAVAPLGVYGASKLAGETAATEYCADTVILRTSWVFSAEGTNFVRTMLHFASERDEIGVVDDQQGAPTFAGDLAGAIVVIADRLASTPERTKLAGVYHVTSAGETTWCRFARAIMAGSHERGGPSCRVRGITTAEYPTRAVRPANSRLDCGKLARVFGLRLPPWQAALRVCLDQLIPTSQRVSL